MLGYGPFSLPPRHLQVAVGVNFAVLFADGDFANVNHGGRDAFVTDQQNTLLTDCCAVANGETKKMESCGT
jgi:hypothetical protein